MKASLKAAWLKALRSGTYRQARKRLYNAEEHSYCCLGVLCQIAEPGTRPYAADGDEILPRELAERLNLNRDPFIHLGELLEFGRSIASSLYPITGQTLAALNDDGLSFAQIADIIEYFLPAEAE